MFLNLFESLFWWGCDWRWIGLSKRKSSERSGSLGKCMWCKVGSLLTSWSFRRMCAKYHWISHSYFWGKSVCGILMIMKANDSTGCFSRIHHALLSISAHLGKLSALRREEWKFNFPASSSWGFFCTVFDVLWIMLNYTFCSTICFSAQQGLNRERQTHFTENCMWVQWNVLQCVKKLPDFIYLYESVRLRIYQHFSRFSTKNWLANKNWGHIEHEMA